MLQAAAVPVPPRQFSKGEFFFLAFVLMQALDGVMSYVGVRSFGSWIEANPLVAWYAATLGPGLAFTVVKIFAIACGALLYLTARHRTVAVLTLFYLAFAVMPWVHVLGFVLNF